MPNTPENRQPALGVNRRSAQHYARKYAKSEDSVRCLGPGNKEHYFRNDGTKGNRICYRCREKMACVPESCIRLVKTPKVK